MPDWLVMLLPRLTTLLFVFAVGACVGSLINVLVYRLPRGLGVVTPPSRCPWCGKVLTWRENIPILGWVILRGRCRFCTARISPEYPIVETLVAVLFGGVYALWYIVPTGWGGGLAPEWAANGPVATWPPLAVLLVLLGSLVAMSIIDARTFTIPLVLTWVPALTALVLHTGHAVWFTAAHGAMEPAVPGVWRLGDGSRWVSELEWRWTLATPALTDWRWIGAALGGTLGLGVSLLLLRAGLVRRSFADYAAWEQGERDRMREEGAGTAVPDSGVQAARRDVPPPLPGTEPLPAGGNDPAMWIMYPHARREMLKEAAFLGPPAGLAYLGAWLAVRITGSNSVEAPLWLGVLAGVLLGYLVGGAVVWGVRIGGSLAFGKEAMGLGDVHLMAAVGACLGWIDPVLAFFAAAFVGVGYVAAGAVMLRRMPRAMPYGPFLAVATVLVVVFKPAFEWGLGRILNQPVHLP